MNRFIKILDLTLKLIGTVLGIGLCIFVGGMISLIVLMGYMLLFNKSSSMIVTFPLPVSIGLTLFFAVFWVITSIQFYVENKRKE